MYNQMASDAVYLIYGGNGFIGSYVQRYLSTLVPVDRIRCSSTRVLPSSYDLVKKEISESTQVICCIGRTHAPGHPNIDYLETNLRENLQDNLFAPLLIVQLCRDLHKHCTLLNTGCIYSSPPSSSPESPVINEQSCPNFFGSSYSIMKGFADQLCVHYDHVLNLRIRLPITGDNHPRSLVQKLLSFSSVSDLPNSITFIPSIFPILAHLIVQKKTGTYHMTNPGSISNRDILVLYQRYVNPAIPIHVDPSISTRRSNVVLSTRLSQEYPHLQSIRECLLEYFQSMNPAYMTMLTSLKYNRTDKHSHTYTSIYHRVWNPHRESIRHVMELGILSGDSLRLWQDYFPHAMIHGVDIMDRSGARDSKDTRIQIHVADQRDHDRIKTWTPSELFDIIIDDGGHTMSLQQTSFGRLFELVKPGGWYVVEDIHTSFMPQFIDSQPTTYDFLVQLKQHQPINSPFIAPDKLMEISKHIDSMEIYQRDPMLWTDSITCIIHKKPVQNVVVITSYLACPTAKSVFSRVQRFEQTQITIESVRRRIPHSYIVLIDASPLTENERVYFSKHVDHIIECEHDEYISKSVSSPNRSEGERAYLLHAFSIVHTLISSGKLMARNIFKISGRYWLNHQFDFSMYDTDTNTIQTVDKTKWNEACVSCLFKLSAQYLPSFLDILQSVSFQGLCTETFLYHYIRPKFLTTHLSVLGCSGHIAINGIYGEC